jgi:class 3 adenylate cyclase
MGPDEFASLVGLTPDEVARLLANGLLDPDADGFLDDVDLVRLGFVRRRLKRGEHDPESLATAIRDGRIESIFGRELFERGTTVSLEDAAARVGVSAEQVRDVLAALGLSGSNLHDSDLVMLDWLRTARDAGLPWDAIVGVAGVFGDSMRRVAETEIRLGHVYIHERLLAAGVPDDQVDELIFGIERNLAPLMDPMLQRLRRAYLLEAAVEDAFLHLAATESGYAALGQMETTIAFVDVASFTALVEAAGDDAAVRVLDRIDVIIRSLLLGHGGKLVKNLGDGFMLTFGDPSAAVRFAVEAQAEIARSADLPAVRVGINTGPVLYRTGEYLGGAVNVAARVAAAAMAEQIVMTEPVARAASIDGVQVEAVGVRMMRGVGDPLALYRVVTAQ